MSTPASNPTPPWEATEPLPSDTERTRPLPSAGSSPAGTAGRRFDAAQDTLPPAGRPAPLPDDPAQPAHSESGAARARSRTFGRALRRDGPGRTAGDVGTTGEGGPGIPSDAANPTHGATPAAREWRTFSPKTLFFGTLDLVVDSVLNTVLLIVILTFLALGAATVPALGLGVLILAATVYVMMGAVWLERRRSASSFGLDIRDPRRRRSPRTDWVRVPHQWWLDASDGSLWLGMLHVVLTCALGWLMLLPFVVGSAALVLTFAPWFAPESSVLWPALQNIPRWALPALSITAVLLSIVLAVLLTLAHRGLSAGLLRLSEAARLRREADELQRLAEYETAAKESAVRGAETERSRIERDLHDGVQPQLVSVAMNLSMARSRIDTDPAAAKELVAEAHGTTKAAITELRRLARGFHPAVLEDRGLDAALSAVAAQAPFPVDVSVSVPRLQPRTEAAIYFAVSESLGNAIKHSGARSADVAVSIQDGAAPGTSIVVAGVRDFGRGGARVVPGGGLSGIQDRIRSAGGRFFVNSPAGGPTEVIVELPLTGTAPTTTPHSTPRASGTAHTSHAEYAGGMSPGHSTGVAGHRDAATGLDRVTPTSAAGTGGAASSSAGQYGRGN